MKDELKLKCQEMEVHIQKLVQKVLVLLCVLCVYVYVCACTHHIMYVHCIDTESRLAVGE